jgi:eukaryotic-like serine/threonine-protein kinase
VRGFRHVWLVPAGLTVGFAVLGVFLPRLALPGAVAAVASAAVAAVGGVWSNRAANALGDARDRGGALRGLVRLDARNRLPRVRDLRDSRDWGVHPAMPLPSVPVDRSPAFVRRDAWERVTTALLRDRFILIVGESTAGKSRIASEAIRELFPGFRLVEPLDRSAAQAAAQTAAATRRSVLWLDDLERFLGSGGLTSSVVGNILRGSDRYVVATMRSEEHAKFNGRTLSGFDGIGRDSLRQGWDVALADYLVRAGQSHYRGSGWYCAGWRSAELPDD